jgi:hypothetical protein
MTCRLLFSFTPQFLCQCIEGFDLKIWIWKLGESSAYGEVSGHMLERYEPNSLTSKAYRMFTQYTICDHKIVPITSLPFRTPTIQFPQPNFPLGETIFRTHP